MQHAVSWARLKAQQRRLCLLHCCYENSLVASLLGCLSCLSLFGLPGQGLLVDTDGLQGLVAPQARVSACAHAHKSTEPGAAPVPYPVLCIQHALQALRVLIGYLSDETALQSGRGNAASGRGQFCKGPKYAGAFADVTDHVGYCVGGCARGVGEWCCALPSSKAHKWDAHTSVVAVALAMQVPEDVTP